MLSKKLEENQLLIFDINLERDSKAAELNHSLVCYVPGDTVKGSVRLVLAKNLSVLGLQLTVYGSGSAHWQESTGEQHMANEVYINEMAELVKVDEQEATTLKKGDHTFPFELELPKTLPSSFTEDHGNVSYVIKCSLRLNNGQDYQPYTKTESILILSRLPLRKELAVPYEGILKKTFSLTVKERMQCGGPRQLRANVALTRRCFVQGECVIINADIFNQSNKVVTSLSCALVAKFEYKTATGTKLDAKLISEEVDKFEIACMESREWRNVLLQIPLLAPSSGFIGNNLIHVIYEIVFKVDFRNEERELLRIPVEIGTEIPAELIVESRPSSLFNGDAHRNQFSSNQIVTNGESQVMQADIPYQQNWNEGYVKHNPLFQSNIEQQFVAMDFQEDEDEYDDEPIVEQNQFQLSTKQNSSVIQNVNLTPVKILTSLEADERIVDDWEYNHPARPTTALRKTVYTMDDCLFISVEDFEEPNVLNY